MKVIAVNFFWNTVYITRALKGRGQRRDPLVHILTHMKLKFVWQVIVYVLFIGLRMKRFSLLNFDKSLLHIAVLMASLIGWALICPENGSRHTHVGQVAGTCGCRYTPETWSAAARVADVRNRTPAVAGAAPPTRCWWGCDADEMRLSSTCHINRQSLQHFVTITPPLTIH